jgi:hypothetical protein
MKKTSHSRWHLKEIFQLLLIKNIVALLYMTEIKILSRLSFLFSVFSFSLLFSSFFRVSAVYFFVYFILPLFVYFHVVYFYSHLSYFIPFLPCSYVNSLLTFCLPRLKISGCFLLGPKHQIASLAKGPHVFNVKWLIVHRMYRSIHYSLHKTRKNKW